MNPESDTGNIEYKRVLTDNSFLRIERIMSQMKYRCEEGSGECIYNIGVDDDGVLIGITSEEYKTTIDILQQAANMNNYILTEIGKTEIFKNKFIYEVHIREKAGNYIDLKVAIAGSVNAAKSSLLGVLTSGLNDNGDGSARLSVFNFPHEVSTGRTSSIGHQIIGFDEKGNIINYGHGHNKKEWSEIARESRKIVTFYDMAGHEKYLKTTIFGLSNSSVDICLIMVSANRGILPMTKEHILLCLALQIPFCLVISKIDLVKDTPNVLEDTMNSIYTFLKNAGLRKIPMKIKNTNDVISCVKQISSLSITPIFQISNVTGECIDLLKQFLNLAPVKKIKHDENNVLYTVDTIWNVFGVGTVLGGHLKSGTVKKGEKVYIGPFSDGSYENIQIKSIHCKREPLQEVTGNKYVCFCIKKFDKLAQIRKGHVIVSSNKDAMSTYMFEAEISIVKSHSTTIKKGYEPLAHIGSIRQTVEIIEIKSVQIKGGIWEIVSDPNFCLRTGNKAVCIFKFCHRPEFLVNNSKILFSEGNVKIIGKVTNIIKD